MSSAHEPLGTRPLEIQRAAQEIIDGEREATEAELVLTFQECIKRHYLTERDVVLRALNKVQNNGENWP